MTQAQLERIVQRIREVEQEGHGCVRIEIVKGKVVLITKETKEQVA